MKEEYENIEHHLDGLKNGKEFRVPEGYFDSFNQRLMERISEENKPVIKLSWYTYLKPALAVAAVLIIAILLVKVPVQIPSRNQIRLSSNENIQKLDQPSNEISSTSLSDELTTYFESLVQLPQSQFLSVLEEDVNQGDQFRIDPKDLEEYLADNSIDYEIISSN